MTACPAARPNKASNTILRLLHLPKETLMGCFDEVPSAFILRQTGDSLKRMRIHTEIPSKSSKIRNGMRQPQSRKASSPNDLRMPNTTSKDRNSPMVAVVCIQLV